MTDGELLATITSLGLTLRPGGVEAHASGWRSARFTLPAGLAVTQFYVAALSPEGHWQCRRDNRNLVADGRGPTLAEALAGFAEHDADVYEFLRVSRGDA